MTRHFRFRSCIYLVGTLAVLVASSFGFAQSPTTTALSLSPPSSAVAGQVVTLTATTLQAGIPVTVGTVTFSDGQRVLGTVQIVKTSGMATLKVRFAPGAHSLVAHFDRTSSLQASQSTPQPLAVTGTEPTITTLTAQPNGSNYDLTASVFGFGFPAETGTATFTDLTTMTNLGNVGIVGPGMSTFQPNQAYPVGEGAAGVAMADFNGDGFADVAITNSSDDTVSVLLGNGDGAFQPQQTFPVGRFPSAIVVADFNGDGIADLGIANGGAATIGVLLGNGDGTFQPQQVYRVGAEPSAVAAADLNGDGFPDLAAANGAQDTVSVLMGNGDGTFQSQQTYPVGGGPIGVAIADFNRDGIADIAIANAADLSAGVSVLLGNGDGTFQPQQTYPGGNRPLGVATADFNVDGIADLATANNGNLTAGVLLGNGDGTFQPEQTYPVGGTPSGIATADFNGDGIADLVIINQPNTVSVLLGKGDGTFQPQQVYSVGTDPGFVATGDLNGDGVPDLAASSNYNDASGRNTISILLGGTVTTGQLTNIPVFGSGNHDVQSIYAPDTNFYTGSLSNIVQVAAHMPDTTNTAVSSTPNPSGYLQSVTLTATVTGGHGGSPTGTVTFTADGNTTCANVPLTQMQNGSTATCPIATLTPGSHSLGAIYSGDPNFASSAGVGSQVVNAVTALAVLTPTSVPFGNGTVGTTSGAQVVVLSNPGNATLNINGIALAGANPSSFNLINGCGATLTAGNSCNLSVTFSPGTTGNFAAAISVTDNAAGSPQTAALSGTGVVVVPAVPQAVLSPTSLTFPSQTTGTTSAAQTATLSNPGNAPLTITGISVAGTNPSDFVQTNTCGSSLAAGASCTISVTFTPASAASFTATISVADNAAGSPQTSALSGTGVTPPPAPDFSVSSSTPVQTVAPGGAANFPISVASAFSESPFTSAVTLTASGLPTGATASFSPAAPTPGSSGATSTLTIQTAGVVAMNAPQPPPTPGPNRTRGYLTSGSLAALCLGFFRRRKHWPPKLAALVMVVFAGLCAVGLSGCGGGFALPAQNISTTYTITVTGTSGADQHSTSVTLTVN